VFNLNQNMSMLSYRKLSANWRRLQQRFGMMIDIAFMRKAFRRCRVNCDWLMKIPKPSRYNHSKTWMPKFFRIRFGPKCSEGLQTCKWRTRNGFRTSQRHAETFRFCEFRFLEPSGGLMDGRFYSNAFKRDLTIKLN